MSKTLDLSDLSALDDDDLQYAHQRGLITDAQLAEHLGTDEFTLVDQIAKNGISQGVPLSEIANTGDANTRGLTNEDLLKEVERRGLLERLDNEKRGAGPAASDDEDDEALVEEPYEDARNDDLRAELSRRGLSVDGNKTELVQRLREDDEAEDDEDEETE